MNTRSDREASHPGSSWDRYWRGTGEVRDWTVGGVSHPALREFWEDCFRQLRAATTAPSVVDIASGNGALVECALTVFEDAPLEITAVDVSEAAVANLRQRFPGVSGVICDAASIPLDSGRFDMVMSQFGVEYAGPGAVGEAARLVAPGGRLVLLMHNLDGIIHAETAADLDGISRLQQSGFIPLATEMFQAGFAAVRGADRAPYDEAAQRLQSAVDALEGVLDEHGERVAGGGIAELYSEVARIHDRLPNYDPDEVLGWLARLESEMDDYARRLESMMAAAMDEMTFQRLCAELRDSHFTLEVAAPLLARNEEQPLAWVLVALAGQTRG